MDFVKCVFFDFQSFLFVFKVMGIDDYYEDWNWLNFFLNCKEFGI